MSSVFREGLPNLVPVPQERPAPDALVAGAFKHDSDPRIRDNMRRRITRPPALRGSIGHAPQAGNIPGALAVEFPNFFS